MSIKINSKSLCLYVPIVLCTLMLGACSRRPKEVLSDDKTAALLADLHIADAYSTIGMGGQSDLSITDNDSLRKVLRQSVLSAHGVSEAQLDTTLGWYGHNLDKYEEMYEKVPEYIAEKRTKLAEQNDKSGRNPSLWPYGSRQRIALGKNRVVVVPFEIGGTSIPKGGKLVWEAKAVNMFEPADMFIAAEYADGSINYVQRTLMGGGRQNVTLQSDSSRPVAKVWGYLRVRQPQTLILDSISLKAAPLNAASYYEYRSTKTWTPK